MSFAAVCVPGKHTSVGMSFTCTYGWIHAISRRPDSRLCKCFLFGWLPGRMYVP